jgi:hypothetical protein
MKEEYDAAIEAHYYQAETATNGNLVRKSSREAGVRALSLFSGPASRAYSHASEELIDFWERHPRPSLEAFESQWLAGRVSTY